MEMPQVPDPLALDMPSFIALEDNIKSVLQLRANDFSKIKNVDELNKRILESIHIKHLDGFPLKLATLNMRAGRACRAFDTTPLSVVMLLTGLGLIEQVQRDRSSILFSKTLLDKQRELCKTFNDPFEPTMGAMLSRAE